MEFRGGPRSKEYPGLCGFGEQMEADGGYEILLARAAQLKKKRMEIIPQNPLHAYYTQSQVIGVAAEVRYVPKEAAESLSVPNIRPPYATWEYS
jgi:hypothetical protein